MKAKHIIVVAVLLVAAACNKNVLEKQPQDTLPPETFYQNGNNLKTALLGVYDALQNDNNFGKIPDLDGISDNGIHFRYETELIAYAQGIANANVTQKFATYYQAGYQLIQRANILLDNIKAPGTITQADRDAIEAEARALRALAYMRLVYFYGDVPLITTFTPLADIKNVSRSPRADVINFIITEMKTAADKLTNKPYSNEKGRLTKQAVLGFRAKVLLYEARLGKRPYTEALTAINEAITIADAAGAGLYVSTTPTNGQANFEGLFALSNIDNKEILFVVKNNDLDRGANLFTFFAAGGGNLSISVHGNLVNDFYCTDGLPITTSPLYSAATPYNNRDPRLKASISTPGDTYSTGTQLLAFNGKTTIGVLQTNFAIKKLTTLNGLAQNQGQLDIPLLRYADLQLMLAEAENEVNGPTTIAYTAINKIRARATVANVVPGLIKLDFKNEVIHERRVEFAFEGQRWLDLVTLGIANQKINAVGELGRKFTPNQQELFPIPQSERSLNPNLTQHLGY
jgi:hypothetical protein